MKILGKEIEKVGRNKLVHIGDYMCELIECGGPENGESRFHARVTRKGLHVYATYGSTEQSAVDNLHERMLSSYQELGELLGPILAEKAKELQEKGEPHPNYGDLFTREAWGNSRPDGSYYPADATHYYPGVSMLNRSEKHTHVLYFSK